MRAVVVRRFGPPSVLTVEDVPVPEPGPGEVLVQVHAVSVNRTLDCAVRAGRYRRPVPLPFTPGVDPSGVIVGVGPGVTDRSVGDRVVARLNVGGEAGPDQPRQLGGGYAEYVCAPSGRTTVLPPELGFVVGTVVARHTPLALTLLRDRGGLRPGDWVVVLGAAGGLGSAGVQVARHLGGRVVAAAGSDERVKVGLDLGAEAGVDYRAADLGPELHRLTAGRGVDVVLDTTGDPGLLAGAFAALARDGRLVTAASHAGGAFPLDLTRLYQQGLTVTGTTRVDPADVAASLAVAAAGGFTALVDRVLPLSQAAVAHELVEARQGLGKVVLEPVHRGGSADDRSLEWGP